MLYDIFLTIKTNDNSLPPPVIDNVILEKLSSYTYDKELKEQIGKITVLSISTVKRRKAHE